MKLFIYVEHNNRNPFLSLSQSQPNESKNSFVRIMFAEHMKIVSEEEINGKLVMKIVALLAIYFGHNLPIPTLFMTTPRIKNE